MNPEILRDLLDRHTGLTVTGDPHNIVAELLRVGLGHSDILPAHHHGKPRGAQRQGEQGCGVAAVGGVAELAGAGEYGDEVG
ncbi:hypothetical protein LFM09_49095 [Lentzea alba]|uniref:hypothetical protein n=1 Tax=Lentzea alba TaxID=2714351 RepID=UPI0039BF3FB6